MDTETDAFTESGVGNEQIDIIPFLDVLIFAFGIDVVFAKPVHLETIHRLLRNCNEIGTKSPNYLDDPSVSVIMYDCSGISTLSFFFSNANCNKKHWMLSE